MNCPWALCHLKQPEAAAKADVFVYGVFALYSEERPNWFGVEGEPDAPEKYVHVHECVILHVDPGGISPWKKPELYWRCLRMVYRMLRHDLTAVEAWGNE